MLRHRPLWRWGDNNFDDDDSDDDSDDSDDCDDERDKTTVTLTTATAVISGVSDAEENNNSGFKFRQVPPVLKQTRIFQFISHAAATADTEPYLVLLTHDNLI